MFDSSEVLVVVRLVRSVRGGQMHDSVQLDHCWLLWHSPNTDLCGPGTCRRPVMCPCTQPGCVETTDSWNLWIFTHAGENEDLTSSQVVFCKYFLESRTCEILSVVSPVGMHSSLLHSGSLCFHHLPSKCIPLCFDPGSLKHPSTHNGEDRHFVKALMKGQHVND